MAGNNGRGRLEISLVVQDDMTPALRLAARMVALILEKYLGLVYAAVVRRGVAALFEGKL